MQAIGSVSCRFRPVQHHRHVPVRSRASTAAARCEGNRMFVFGLGFVGRYVSDRLKKDGWEVAGTCTSAIRKRELEEANLDAFIFDAHKSKLETLPSLQNATHLLISIPPIPGISDPLLSLHKDLQMSCGNLKWLCYLSTTSVYGDCGGALVCEDYPVNPTGESAQSRVEAEKGWLDLGRDLGVSAYVFRLGGIYGPGRSALDTIIKQKSMSAKRMMRKSKLFTARVHVADIYQAIKASFGVPSSGFLTAYCLLGLSFSEMDGSCNSVGRDLGEIYNVVDDDPSPRAEVFAYAQALLKSKCPNEIGQFQEGNVEDLENQKVKFDIIGGEKRVSNARLKEQLGVKLLYPTYKSGLQSILDYYWNGQEK